MWPGGYLLSKKIHAEIKTTRDITGTEKLRVEKIFLLSEDAAAETTHKIFKLTEKRFRRNLRPKSK